MTATNVSDRTRLLGRALLLAYITVAWNIVEGVIAVTAALAAGSVALLGFGIDSFVETTSGAVVIWRLKAEHGLTDAASVNKLDERAHKLVAWSLFLLAAFIIFDATKTLWFEEHPEPTLVGIVLTAASLLVMMKLAAAKKRVANGLHSRALAADAFQTTACWWLSLVALAGMAINAVSGWWWADPVAALGMTYFIVREGLEAWKGEDECCS